ncbi:MAG: hypothetical protein PHT59_06465 [Candidatus Omnitrophica bacterium]|nr:hypothetical protein [Candidatus Omnitrophota bacterium]
MPESELSKLTNNEVEVEGFKLAPWCIGNLAELAPDIERVMARLKERGVTMTTWREKLTDIIFQVLPEAPRFISVSTGKPIEEISKLPSEKAFRILSAIISLNLGYLKNWLGPAERAAQEIANG